MHFAGQPNSVRVNQDTYRVCVEQGWIVPVEHWPYHETTEAGRQLLPA